MRRAALPRLALAALALAACDKPAPPARPPVAAALTPPSGVLALVAAPIDTAVTLGRWLADHPGDAIQDSVPPGAHGQSVCRIAVATAEMGGRTVARSALFGVPAPPPGEVLPDSAGLAERECRLRAIWLVVTESDSALATRLSDSLGLVLDRALGAGRPGLEMLGEGVGPWIGRRSWTGPGTTVVRGILPATAATTDEGRPVPARPGRVIIAAFAPKFGLDKASFEETLIGADDAEAGERDLELSLADSALGWAGIPALTAALRPAIAFARANPDSARTPAVDSALVRSAAIVHALESSSLDPARHAAALVAADLAVEHSAHSLDDDSASANRRLRRALEASGAKYEFEQLGGAYFYTRPWLWQAYHLDSLGRAGHVALLSLLRSDWTTRPGCEPTPGEKGEVVENGEAALARGDSDPVVHYYVGLGYHDVVALSRGGTWDDYVDSKEYLPRAPAARTKALAHLRAALGAGGLTDRRMRRQAWRTAVLLMLGHAGRTRFFCVND